MWRDILIILAFVLATLSYFRITPRRIYGYIKTARVEIAKEPANTIPLASAISLTLFSIIWLIYKYEDWRPAIWPQILFLIVMNDLLWFIILGDSWKLFENRVFLIVTLSIAFLANTGYSILEYTDLWKKILYIVMPIIAFGVGYGAAALKSYISTRFKLKG